MAILGRNRDLQLQIVHIFFLSLIDEFSLFYTTEQPRILSVCLCVCFFGWLVGWFYFLLIVCFFSIYPKSLQNLNLKFTLTNYDQIVTQKQSLFIYASHLMSNSCYQQKKLLVEMDRLDRWSHAKLMNFNKAKCKVLSWGNPKNKHRLVR